MRPFVCYVSIVTVAFCAIAANAATALYEAPQGFETAASPQVEAVLLNPLAQWPKGADRLYLEIWGAETDEAIANVVVSGSKKGVSAKKELRRFDLPQNGLRAVTVGLGEIGNSVDLSAVSNIVVRTDDRKPRRFALARALLLDKGEPKPVVEEAPRVHPLDTAAHHADYLRFREECRQGDVVVGHVSSMEAVRPRAAFRWKPIHDIYVRLARGERESFQVLVAPADGDLKDVSVVVDMGEDSAFSPTNFTVGVVGYVETKTPPWPYKVRPAMKLPSLGWWPDAILDFQKSTDISGEDVQSFWVRVTCPTNQPAGDYVGRVKIMVGGREAEKGVLHLHVNDFAVGRDSPLPMIVSFNPNKPGMKKGEKLSLDDYHFAWKTRKEAYCDWLADYYITMGTYYTNDKLEPHWDMLLRLKEQGRLGLFNLCFWWRVDHVFTEEVYKTKCMPVYRARYNKAKELGLLDHAVFGGCSEQKPQYHKGIAQAVKILKEEFPDVPIISSAQDFKRGTDGSPLSCLDASIAVVNRYYPEVVKKAREEGRKVWWYICNWPNAPWVNAILEDPPCQLRVLMGALTQKCKPDGFLYWETAAWTGDKPVTKGPYLDWNPRTFGEWDGDGQWTYCGGPDLMPIPTIRLENFRDGLEDLWYVKLLDQKLKEVESGKLEVRSEGWMQRAKYALDVPDSVARNGKDFSVDPEVIYRWREEMADLIEESGQSDQHAERKNP